MPLPKARKGMKKATKRRVVSRVMHELSSKGSKRRPRAQKIAIALKQAKLSRRGKRKK